MKQLAVRVLPVVGLFALACASKAADTTVSNPEPEADASQMAQSEPEGPAAPAPDLLQANQRDIESLRQMKGELEQDTRDQIQTIDTLQKALDELTRMATTANLKEDRLNTIVGEAARKGQYRGSQKFAKADRDAAKERLKTIHENADELDGVSAKISDALMKVEQERAQAQELLSTIEGRSNAVASTPDATQTQSSTTIHPDLVSQINAAREAFASLDATATASVEVLQEALLRAKSMTEALGADASGPRAKEVDVTEATGVTMPNEASTTGQSGSAAKKRGSSSATGAGATGSQGGAPSSPPAAGTN